jgi:chromosome segregation ATPase
MIAGELRQEITTLINPLRWVKIGRRWWVNFQCRLTVDSLKDQATTQKSHLEAVEKQRDEANKAHLESCHALAKKDEELKSTRSKADKLTQELADTKAELDQAVTAKIDAEKESKRREGQISELTIQLENLQKKLDEEAQKFIQAHTASAVASARLEDVSLAPSEEPEAEPVARTRPAKSSSTRKKTGKEGATS